MEFFLILQNAEGPQRIPLAGSRLTVGRNSGDVPLPDPGLSRLHATFYRQGESFYVRDEDSTNGTFVNDEEVPAGGRQLQAGDIVTLGQDVTIEIEVSTTTQAAAATTAGPAPPAARSFPLALAAGLLIGVISVSGILVYALTNRRGDAKTSRSTNTLTPDADEMATPPPMPTPTPTPTPDLSLAPDAAGGLAPNTTAPPANGVSAPPPNVTAPAPIVTGPQQAPAPKPPPARGRPRLYREMNEAEKFEFVRERARHISGMMGNRPYEFANDDVIRIIKNYVDGFARRVGNGQKNLWGEDMNRMFARASASYTPDIIQAFQARGVPIVVGVYIVVVETEYHNIRSENFAGAAGLFQFIGPTARGYGVDPSERTNVAKMAPAAANYIADRISEFGTDSMSVALGIAGYNRSPDSVRRDLHVTLGQVANSKDKERTFWHLVANSEKLDHYFRGENIKYVPKFFGAAIIGENPWAFGITGISQPLSTYSTKNANATVGDDDTE